MIVASSTQNTTRKSYARVFNGEASRGRCQAKRGETLLKEEKTLIGVLLREAQAG